MQVLSSEAKQKALVISLFRIVCRSHLNAIAHCFLESDEEKNKKKKKEKKAKKKEKKKAKKKQKALKKQKVGVSFRFHTCCRLKHLLMVVMETKLDYFGTHFGGERKEEANRGPSP